MAKTIYIVGRGLDPAKHLTLDGIAALKDSELVLGYESEIATWQRLSAQFAFPMVQGVESLYVHGGRDLENYQRFVDYILEQTQRFQKISLLVAGHPRLGVSFIRLLAERVADLQIELKIIEAVSSYDILINDLAIDPIDRGMSMLDANRLCLFEYHLEPSIGHFIYHVCSVGTVQTNINNPEEGNKIKMLQEHLETYYDKKKKYFFARHQTAQKIRLCIRQFVLVILVKTSGALILEQLFMSRQSFLEI